MVSCKTSTTLQNSANLSKATEEFYTNEPMGELENVKDHMPLFPGCFDPKLTKRENDQCAQMLLLEYIEGNRNYPPEALKNKTEGTVVIKFTIEKDGTISGAKILREIGDGCGQEGKRIIESMPNWIPGRQRGENVKVNFNIPIRFKLSAKG